MRVRDGVYRTVRPVLVGPPLLSPGVDVMGSEPPSPAQLRPRTCEQTPCTTSLTLRTPHKDIDGKAGEAWCAYPMEAEPWRSTRLCRRRPQAPPMTPATDTRTGERTVAHGRLINTHQQVLMRSTLCTHRDRSCFIDSITAVDLRREKAKEDRSVRPQSCVRRECLCQQCVRTLVVKTSKAATLDTQVGW